MANPPRTHTTKVATLWASGEAAGIVGLPHDWQPGTRVAVIDLTDLPPGLTPNLGGGGTWTGTAGAAAEAGMEARERTTGEWGEPNRFAFDRIVQARPAPQPPTETVTDSTLAEVAAERDAWKNAALIYRQLAADGVLRLKAGYSYAKAQDLYDEGLAAQPDGGGDR